MVLRIMHGIVIFNTIDCTTKNTSLVLPVIARQCQTENEKAPYLRGL